MRSLVTGICRAQAIVQSSSIWMSVQKGARGCEVVAFLVCLDYVGVSIAVGPLAGPLARSGARLKIVF